VGVLDDLESLGPFTVFGKFHLLFMYALEADQCFTISHNFLFFDHQIRTSSPKQRCY
jgi:hypothetical protein